MTHPLPFPVSFLQHPYLATRGQAYSTNLSVYKSDYKMDEWIRALGMEVKTQFNELWVSWSRFTADGRWFCSRTSVGLRWGPFLIQTPLHATLTTRLKTEKVSIALWGCSLVQNLIIFHFWRHKSTVCVLSLYYRSVKISPMTKKSSDTVQSVPSFVLKYNCWGETAPSM